MKNPIIKIAVLVNLLLINFACDENTLNNDIKDDEPSSVILPLKVGNSWINKVSYFPVFGTKDTVYYDTSRVYGDTIINNERWYKTTYGLLKNKSDGLWYYNLLSLKYPSTSGDSLEWKYSWRIITVSPSETVSTVYGKSNCYHYRSQSYEYKNEIYLMPNIGYVGVYSYHYSYDSSKWILTIKTELVSATLK